MRTLAIAAVTGAALSLAAPASAEVGDGPASVTLDACAQGATQSDTYLPDCSFVNLVGKDAPSYTYVTSQGPISWSGTSASGLISFPAAEQTWPPLTGLDGNRSITWTPEEISGFVDDNGAVRLAMQYTMTVDIPEGIAAGQCSLSGIVELRSEGTEYRSEQAAGQNWDPVTGRFAAVSTNAFPLIPALNATCLRFGTQDYDLLKGASWYVTGTMTLPSKPPVVVVQAQRATVKLPQRIKPKGKTVLLKGPVVTNAGQRANVEVTWRRGNSPKFASLKTTKSGKVTIRTTGKAKRMQVTVRLTAGSTPEYRAYSKTTTWLVRR